MKITVGVYDPAKSNFGKTQELVGNLNAVLAKLQTMHVVIKKAEMSPEEQKQAVELMAGIG